MGANKYTETEKGTNIRDIFNKLVQEAKNYNGNDSYNGTISTTQLGHKINLPKEILKNEKNLNNYIYDEKNDSLLFYEKRQTGYADLGVSHYEAFVPNWIEDLQKPKIEKGVKTLSIFSISIKREDYGTGKRYATLGEAKKAAKEYSMSSKDDVTVYKHRSNGTKYILGHFKLTSDGKEYKSARTSKNKLYLPINEYIFFVYAAC